MGSKDNELSLGAVELSSRLTNPELLVETGYRFLERYDSDFIKMINYYHNLGAPLPISLESASRIVDALSFLDDRLSELFPEFEEKVKVVKEMNQEQDLRTRLRETGIFLRQAKAFADLTKE